MNLFAKSIVYVVLYHSTIVKSTQSANKKVKRKKKICLVPNSYLSTYHCGNLFNDINGRYDRPLNNYVEGECPSSCWWTDDYPISYIRGIPVHQWMYIYPWLTMHEKTCKWPTSTNCQLIGQSSQRIRWNYKRSSMVHMSSITINASLFLQYIFSNPS